MTVSDKQTGLLLYGIDNSPRKLLISSPRQPKLDILVDPIFLSLFLHLFAQDFVGILKTSYEHYLEMGPGKSTYTFSAFRNVLSATSRFNVSHFPPQCVC
jgi:hypothetical protein